MHTPETGEEVQFKPRNPMGCRGRNGQHHIGAMYCNRPAWKVNRDFGVKTLLMAIDHSQVDNISLEYRVKCAFYIQISYMYIILCLHTSIFGGFDGSMVRWFCDSMVLSTGVLWRFLCMTVAWNTLEVKLFRPAQQLPTVYLCLYKKPKTTTTKTIGQNQIVSESEATKKPFEPL